MFVLIPRIVFQERMFRVLHFTTSPATVLLRPIRPVIRSAIFDLFMHSLPHFTEASFSGLSSTPQCPSRSPSRRIPLMDRKRLAVPRSGSADVATNRGKADRRCHHLLLFRQSRTGVRFDSPVTVALISVSFLDSHSPLIQTLRVSLTAHMLFGTVTHHTHPRSESAKGADGQEATMGDKVRKDSGAAET